MDFDSCDCNGIDCVPELYRIPPKVWTASTFGGTDSSGDFHQPYDVDVDSAGNVYVADTNNHRIRKLELK